MSLYEKDVFESRDIDERGERIGETSSKGFDALEWFEEEDARDAKSTSSPGADMACEGRYECNASSFFNHRRSFTPNIYYRE
jgi:hypothetical protein